MATSAPSPQWQLVQGMGKLTLQSPAPNAPSQAPSQQWQILGQAASQQGQQGQSQWQMVSPQQQWQMPQTQAAFIQQMVNPMAYSPALPPFGVFGGPVGPAAHCDVQRIRVGTTESKDERLGVRWGWRMLGALIVTITEGSSYDPIFQQVEQTDDQGPSGAWWNLRGHVPRGPASGPPGGAAGGRPRAAGAQRRRFGGAAEEPAAGAQRQGGLGMAGDGWVDGWVGWLGRHGKG
eukprot:Skav204078  [mRNA]  locus=scaffold3129:58343:60790:+ [translate_table: standard]